MSFSLWRESGFHAIIMCKFRGTWKGIRKGFSMYQMLIQTLTDRAEEISKRQGHLEKFIKEYEALEDEHKHIAALLATYNILSTNAPNVPSVHAQASLQKEHLLEESNPASHPLTQPSTRYSPGQTELNIDKILSSGEKHSIISLTRRIEAVLNIRHSDSTVGVVLKRGLKTGKYVRDANQWSMRVEQSQVHNDNANPLLATIRMEDSERNE